MVIVEYCKYGNLSNFLRAKREFFLPYRVNEMERLTFYNMMKCIYASSYNSTTISDNSNEKWCNMSLCLQDRSPKTQSQVRRMIEAGQAGQLEHQASSSSNTSPAAAQSRGEGQYTHTH